MTKLFRPLLLLLCVLALAADEKKPETATKKTLDIYFIDVGQGVGNATLLVSPSGETMLLDCGPDYAAKRTLEAIKAAGVKRIDYLVTTHFHNDHGGAAEAIAAALPIGHFVDHGPSVELGKDDKWWKERRGPWFREGMGKAYDQKYQAYLKVRENSRHLVVKPGDVIPIKGMEVRVVCAGGKILDKPLPGTGEKNPAAEGVDHRGDDDAEDAQSIGVLVTTGKFRFVYLGDLTWNIAHSLFAPINKVGTCDAYLVTHHAQSLPKELGDYYYGLSSCPKSEVHGLRPRVAILSLGSRGHPHGEPEAMKIVRSSPGLEDLWQTNFVETGAEKNQNSPKDFCASIGGMNQPVRFIKLSAQEDGSFQMLNSRNNFSKKYPPRKD